MIFSLYVINKAGGLIYQADFAEGLAKLSANDYLILAGTFHGIHAISSQISPVAGSSGIETLETDAFRLQCFQTLTGIKFLLLTDPRQAQPDLLIRKIYELYADYVMKVAYSFSHHACKANTEEPILSAGDADKVSIV